MLTVRCIQAVNTQHYQMGIKMTQIKDTKVAKHFTIPMFRFMWQIVVGVLGVAALWYALVGDVKMNAQVIAVHTTQITDNKSAINTHVDETKGEPLSELQLQNKVDNLMDDVNDHDIKLNSHDTLITEHGKSIAIQQVQYDNIIEKLEVLINK